MRTVGHLENQLYYERHPDLQRMHALCHVQVRQPVEARRILTALTESEAGARDFEAWRLTADVAVLLEDSRLLRIAADRMVQAAPTRSEGFLTQAVSRPSEGDVAGALKSVRLAVERAAEGDSTPARLEELLLQELQLEQLGRTGAGSR
ncbi:hypothetical protein Pla163_02020 [Planctomycetes bacterium Pla163]|uniref:Uncharacterized protein n=1 Tax=Rohdeia mirabilis TaxID=2528008 RepID=A0A518CV52_9BACT|nr:hypothetical protein Pla163_02020 [Planctomycetes bacterium Pla163]